MRNLISLIFFRSLYFFLFFSILFSSGQAQLVINEIQASPVGDEPEWVEILNCSDSTIYLKSAWFSDAVSYKKLPDLIIDKTHFAILTKDTLTLKSLRNIPKSAILIEFSMPALNNTWDCLAIRYQDSSIIDSVYYNMSWGAKGISLERIDCNQPAYDSRNWLPSKSLDSTTCGYINSNTRKDLDLKVQSINYILNHSIKIDIINNGKKETSQTELLCEIKNVKSKLELPITIPSLSPQTKFSFDFEFDSLSISSQFFGYFNCIVISKLDTDEDRTNDTLASQFYLSYPIKTILINEFLLESTDYNSDFVELYNTSEDTIQLNYWLIHDKTVTSKADTFRITSNNFYILPKGYAVVAFDSSFFSKFSELFGSHKVFAKNSSFNLNADEDEIVIKDPNYLTIDSLRYNKKWHLEEIEFTKDISLEKINPSLLSNIKESWTSSTAAKGSTPAKENSILQPIEQKGVLSATPNPFSPFSSNRDQFCLISYTLPFNQAKINANVFNLNGEKVRELCNLEVSSAQGNFVWDGKNNNGFALEIGPYILLLEAIDLLNGKVFSEKIVLIIGK